MEETFLGLYRSLNNGKWKNYITTDEAWFYMNNVNGNGVFRFMVWGGASFNDALRLYPDGDFVFHHDSAPSHISKITTEFMKGKLKFISQEKWMPKSPDAAPMDYFVWGYMKQQLWRTKAKDVAALKRIWKDMPQELVNKTL
ncbi:hypothetical protein ILUMI_15422, partial [Ignelater luminosus]